VAVKLDIRDNDNAPPIEGTTPDRVATAKFSLNTDESMDTPG
jgi:hypothetical protein